MAKAAVKKGTVLLLKAPKDSEEDRFVEVMFDFEASLINNRNRKWGNITILHAKNFIMHTLLQSDMRFHLNSTSNVQIKLLCNMAFCYL